MDNPVAKQPEFEAESNSSSDLSLNSILSEASDSSSDSVSVVSSVESSDFESDVAFETGETETIPALTFAEVVNDTKAIPADTSERSEHIELPRVEIKDRASSTEAEVVDQSKSAPELEVIKSGAVVVAASDKVIRVASDNVVKVESAERVEVSGETDRVEEKAEPAENKLELPIALSALGTDAENIYVEGTVLTNVDKSLQPYQLAIIGERVQIDPDFDPSKIESTVNFNTNIRSRDMFVADTPVSIAKEGGEIRLTSAGASEETDGDREAFFERALANVVRTNTEIIATGSRSEVVNRNLTAEQLAQISARVARDPEFDPASITTNVNLTQLLNQDLVVAAAGDTVEGAGVEKNGASVEAGALEKAEPVSAGEVRELPPALSALVKDKDSGSEPVAEVKTEPVAETNAEINKDKEVVLPPALAGLGEAVRERNVERAELTRRYSPVEPVIADAEVKATGKSVLGMEVVKEPVTVISTGRVEAPVVLDGGDRIEATREVAPAIPVLDKTAAAATDFISRVRVNEEQANKQLDPPGKPEPTTFFSIRAENATTTLVSDRALLATETAVLAKDEVRDVIDTSGIKSREELVVALSTQPEIAREIAYSPSAVSNVNLGDVPVTERIARHRVESALTERVEPVQVGSEVSLERTTAAATSFLKHVRAEEEPVNKELDAGRSEPDTYFSIRAKIGDEPATTIVKTDNVLLDSETTVLSRPEIQAVINTGDMRSRDELRVALAKAPVVAGEIVSNSDVVDTRLLGDVAANEIVAQRRTELAGYRKVESVPVERVEPIQIATEVPQERTTEAATGFLKQVRAEEEESNKKLDAGRTEPETFYSIRAKLGDEPATTIVREDTVLLASETTVLSRPDVKAVINTGEIRSRDELRAALAKAPVVAGEIVSAPDAVDTRLLGDVAANETDARRRTELAVHRKVDSLPTEVDNRSTVVVDSGLHHGERGADRSADSGVTDFLARVKASEVAVNKKLDVASESGETRLADLPVIAAPPEHRVVVAERLLTSQDVAALAATEKEFGRVDTTEMKTRKDLLTAIESNPVLASNIVKAYGEDRGHAVNEAETIAQTMNRVIREQVVPATDVVDSKVVRETSVAETIALAKVEIARTSSERIAETRIVKPVGPVVALDNDLEPNHDLVEAPEFVAAKFISRPDRRADNDFDSLIESNKNFYARGYAAPQLTSEVARTVESAPTFNTLARQSNQVDGTADLRSLTLPLNGNRASVVSLSTIGKESALSVSAIAKSVSSFDYSVVKQVSDAAAVSEAGRKSLINGLSTGSANISSIQVKSISTTDAKVQGENRVAKAGSTNFNTRVEGALPGSIIDTSARVQTNSASSISLLNLGSNVSSGSELAGVNGDIKVAQLPGLVKVDGRRVVTSDASIAVVSTLRADFTLGTVKGEYKSVNINLDGRSGVVKADLSGSVKSLPSGTQSVNVIPGINLGGKSDVASIVVKADGTISTNKIETPVKAEVSTVRSVENIIQTAKTIVNNNTANGLIAAVKYGEPLPEGMTYENGFIKLTHNGQVLYFPGLRAALKFVEGLGLDVNLDEDDDEEWYVQTLDKEGKSSRVQYIVVPGDTIESICETRLGDARYAELLITINRSEVVYRLHNGVKVPFVYPSQVLWLPSRYEMKVFRKNFFKESQKAPQRFDATNFQLSPSGNLVVQEAGNGSADNPEKLLAKLHEEVVEHYKPSKTDDQEVVAQDQAFVSGNGDSGPLAMMIDRVRFAGGRESVQLKDCPQSVGNFSKRSFHPVEEGDTILSIAKDRPELSDTRFWKLIAQVNGLTTRLDAFGIPCETLVPGQFLLLPDAKEIETFCQQQGIAREEDNSLDAKTVLTSELNLVSFSDQCRVSEIALGGEAHAFSINLQVKDGKQWKTIANYHFQGGKSVRTTYAKSGVTSSMVINLPADIVKEMAYEDFNRNWQTRIKLYESDAEKVDTKNNLGEPPRPAFIAVNQV